MKLGQLIDMLKLFDKDKTVAFDFGYFVPTTVASYRGYYDQLALGYSAENSYMNDNALTVGGLLTELEGAIGKTFTGWKGGDFTMDENTQLWVDNPGECAGVQVTGVEYHSFYVVMRTRLVDD